MSRKLKIFARIAKNSLRQTWNFTKELSLQNLFEKTPNYTITFLQSFEWKTGRFQIEDFYCTGLWVM